MEEKSQNTPKPLKKASNMEEAEELKRKRREQKPFFYCRFIAKYPVAAFLITFFGHLVLVIVSGILLGTGYNLFPVKFDVLPMELYNVPYRLRDLAWRDRNRYSNRISRSISNIRLPTYERGLLSIQGSVDLWYDSKGGNIFSKSNFKKIKDLENALMADEQYTSGFCMTFNSSLICRKPKSILRYFDGTYFSIDPTFYDPNFDNITSVLHAAYTNKKTKSNFEDFLPKQFRISPTEVSATHTRSLLLVGCSASGSTRCSAYGDKTKAFLIDTLQPKLKVWGKNVESNFDFYYFSSYMWQEDVQKQAMIDMLFAIGSLFTIFLFMLIHTRSCWITFWAVLSIMLSFTGTNFIYRVVFDFQYFGYFHILVIFIILGIGADDLFVFYDTWRLTAYSYYPSLAHRLSDAYRKSVLSMLITSLTTMTAFIVSAMSPLLATKSFGIFAAVLVGYNYISVIVFFPAVVMIYHLKFENWTWPCCRCCKSSENIAKDDFTYSGNINQAFDKSDQNFDKAIYPSKTVYSNTASVEYYDKPYVTVINHTYSNRTETKDNHEINVNVDSSKYNEYVNRDNQSSSGTSSETQASSSVDDIKIIYEISRQPKHQKHQKRLVIFFRKHYFKFITNNVVRCILIPVFFGTVAFFAYKASLLEPDNEGLNVYKSGHNYAKALKQEQYSMLHSTDDTLAVLYIAFGLLLKDRHECHFSAINCRGKEQYDEEFNPNPIQNQIALKHFCDTIYNFTEAEISEYHIKKNRDTGQIEVACFTRDLDMFLSKQSLPGMDNLTLPWDYNKVRTFISAMSSQYNVSLNPFNQSFDSYLQIPLQYWLYNGGQMTYTDDYGTYNDLIGEQSGPFTTSPKENRGLKYGNKIKYIGVRINTTVNTVVTGYSEGIPIIEKWENFISSQMQNMPKGINKGFQLTRNTWHWLYVQKSLSDNAILGIVVGVSLALPILTIATMNIVIGFFATLSICCTTICVIGVIPLAGWKLGVLVSLNMCMLVGLAVDYVVHLAEGYTMSEHKDRLSRTRDMLEEMATSVFAGACTTLGASLFMFFTEIQFFTQFGIFLFCTVGFSLFFSLGMFTVLMSLIGPENDFGSLAACFRKCRRKFSA